MAGHVLRDFQLSAVLQVGGAVGAEEWAESFVRMPAAAALRWIIMRTLASGRGVRQAADAGDAI